MKLNSIRNRPRHLPDHEPDHPEGVLRHAGPGVSRNWAPPKPSSHSSDSGRRLQNTK